MLEHIFIFSKSEWREHRVLVSRCLADWMEEVDVCDALEYIFPLLNSLAGDGAYAPLSLGQ
jgi:serine/threonine-protein phosphatase 4 regulatory subunit 1